MLKICMIVGIVISLLGTFELWCALKVASDDDDFWGISDVWKVPPNED